MSGADPLVRAVDLALGYGGAVVLRDVQLEIRAGEYWFLVGPNGSGKSTFTRALFGMVRPAAGELWVDPVRAPRQRWAFVPQRSVVDPSVPTTVREQVALGLVGIRVTGEEAAARVAHALEQVDLAGRALDDFWALSGGQRQRVMLARALVRRPTLLVLDEPEAGLDLAAEERLLALLDVINRDYGVTLVHVSHDLGSVGRHATHVALFHDGGVESGPAAAVLTRARLERAYGVAVPAALGAIA
ncbi:MAG: metal ABC transporter ATP-binding protein [Deltaproteobacteria bacterium]|nr:metal ABC transporter ATP-binding protein [Deltaproteobacteria bacterium]